MVLSTGNSSKMNSGTAAAAAGLSRQADFQVFLDRQQRKDLAALRHIADAERRAPFRRQPMQSPSPSKRSAGADRQQAHDAFQQRGLADAVAAHQAGHEPSGPPGEIEIPQGMALAVILVETLQPVSIGRPPDRLR
jgi:predicted nucleic acid-binding Zn ribbon protein